MVRGRVKEGERDSSFAGSVYEQVVPEDHSLVKLPTGVDFEGGTSVGA
jgi:hypothetical protein